VTNEHRQKEVEKTGDRQEEDVAKNMAINHQINPINKSSNHPSIYLAKTLETKERDLAIFFI
jgi:hypothetical protein